MPLWLVLAILWLISGLAAGLLARRVSRRTSALNNKKVPMVNLGEWIFALCLVAIIMPLGMGYLRVAVREYRTAARNQQSESLEGVLK